MTGFVLAEARSRPGQALALLVTLLVGCGAGVGIAPERRVASDSSVHTARWGVEQAGDEVVTTTSSSDAPAESPDSSAPASPAIVPLDAEPTDHATLPCFGSESATPIVLDGVQDPASVFHLSVRASVRPSRELLRVRPGTTVRFAVSLTNSSADAVFLSPRDIASLATMWVTALDARWMDAARAAGPLHPGQRVDPGGIVRFCVAFDVPRLPIDASPDDERERTYTLAWAPFTLEGLTSVGETRRDRPIVIALPTISVRYPSSRSPRRRDPGSWFGLVRVVLAEGASPIAIARETGVRIGGAGALAITQRGGAHQPPPPPVAGELFQAPPEMEVADAVAALVSRPDVLSAVPVMRADTSARCNQYSPCAPEPCCRP